jgi:hypothetical protein
MASSCPAAATFLETTDWAAGSWKGEALMSQPPPPPPYDGPPAPVEALNPYGPSDPHAAVPAAPYPPAAVAPRRGMTNAAKFWIGFVLALPANFIAAMIAGAGSAAGDAIAPDSALSGVISGILGLAYLGGLVAGVVVERTRRFALGLLAGSILMLALAVGVFVVFLLVLVEAFS